MGMYIKVRNQTISVTMRTPGIGNRKKVFNDMVGRGLEKKHNVGERAKQTLKKSRKLHREFRKKRITPNKD